MKKGKEREEILYFLVFQLEQINIYLPCTLIVIPFSIFQRRISRRNNASSSQTNPILEYIYIRRCQLKIPASEEIHSREKDGRSCNLLSLRD